MKLAILFLFIISSSKSFSSKKNVRIVLNNWTSQIVLSKILGNLALQLGYNVEYIELKVDEQWGYLGRNLADIQIEVWQGTMEKNYNKLIMSKKAVDAGEHDAITREEWWIPSYVKPLCPGLPNWKALAACSHLFADQKNSLNGIYYGGPWEKPDKARVKALGMNFLIKRAKNGDHLWKLLRQHNKDKKPIVLFNWTPNWVESVYEGEFINFPDHHPDCETKPSWGINPQRKFDCGNPKVGWLKKVISNRLNNENQCISQLVKNFTFNNQSISTLSAKVDYHKASIDKTSSDWIKKNKKTWKKWIPKECQ